MEFVAFEDQRCPDDWIAEAMDSESRFHHAFFSGPRAEKDAREFAARRNTELGGTESRAD